MDYVISRLLVLSKVFLFFDLRTQMSGLSEDLLFFAKLLLKIYTHTRLSRFNINTLEFGWDDDSGEVFCFVFN